MPTLRFCLVAASVFAFSLGPTLARANLLESHLVKRLDVEGLAARFDGELLSRSMSADGADDDLLEKRSAHKNKYQTHKKTSHHTASTAKKSSSKSNAKTVPTVNKPIVKAATTKATESAKAAAAAAAAAEASASKAAAAKASASNAAAAASKAAAAKAAGSKPAPGPPPSASPSSDGQGSNAASSYAAGSAFMTSSIMASVASHRCGIDAACAALSIPANANAYCQNHKCTYRCNTGYYPTDSGTCAQSPTTCGSTTCVVPSGGYVTCNGGTCQSNCYGNATPFSRNGGAEQRCIDVTADPSNCGQPGTTCHASYNGVGSPLCRSGTCSLTCPPGKYPRPAQSQSEPFFCA